MNLGGRALLLVVLLTAGGPSCGGSQRFTSDVSDYAQYRRVRLASGVHERLRQGWVYLKQHPNGAFRNEIQPWFTELEQQVVKQSWDHKVRLEAYLSILADGPHAGPVRARLVALNRLAAEKSRSERNFFAAERARGERLERAKEARAGFIRQIRAALLELLSVGDFGKPLAAWDSGFRQSFFEQRPRGYCEAALCEKRWSASFDIPEGRGLSTRHVEYQLTLRLRAGVLESAELSGIGLFSRLSEAADLRPVGKDDLQARAEAIAMAVQLIGLSVEGEFPEGSCQSEVISPVVLARSCEGRNLAAIAAEGAGEPDTVRLSLPPSGVVEAVN